MHFDLNLLRDSSKGSSSLKMEVGGEREEESDSAVGEMSGDVLILT